MAPEKDRGEKMGNADKVREREHGIFGQRGEGIEKTG